jgi:hypothetical protein
LKAFLYLPLIALSLGLSACQPTSTKEEPFTGVQCVVAQFDEPAQLKWGARYAKDKEWPLTRWVGFGCGQGWKTLTDTPYRKDLSAKVFSELFRTQPAFRYGYYSQSRTILPEEARTAMGELGLFMEKATLTRYAAATCGLASREVLNAVAQVEVPFAIASIGVRSVVLSSEAATQEAAYLIEKVANAAESLRPESVECKVETTMAFKDYMQAMNLFISGNHPWAPGCRAVQDDGIRLVCDGTEALSSTNK